MHFFAGAHVFAHRASDAVARALQRLDDVVGAHLRAVAHGVFGIDMRGQEGVGRAVAHFKGAADARVEQRLAA